jgi:hypothetical protein
VYDLESALTSLGIGEAVVTVLSERGAPTPVAWTRLRSPRSLMAAIGNDAIGAAAKASPLQAKYGQTIDRESAYEKLNAKAAQSVPAEKSTAPSKPARAPEKKPGWWKRFVNSRGFQTFLNALGRELVRSMLGSNKRRR